MCSFPLPVPATLFRFSALSGEMNVGLLLTVARYVEFSHIYFFATPRMAEVTAAELQIEHPGTAVSTCDKPLKDQGSGAKAIIQS